MALTTLPFFQINSSVKEQWKLLLEQKSIGYIFPGDKKINAKRQLSDDVATSNSLSKSNDDDWQIVYPLATNSGEEQDEQMTTSPECSNSDEEQSAVAMESESDDGIVKDESGEVSEIITANGGILPAARARLVSLRDLGAKKIGALKLKLAENRMKVSEKGKSPYILINLENRMSQFFIAISSFSTIFSKILLKSIIVISP